jgi:hypothetical protein
MTTGFIQRFKGKIKAQVIYLGTGGIVQSDGTPSATLWTNAGAPTNGTSGTKAGLALPGDLLIDTTNKALYQNTNTLLSPTWTAAPLTGVAGITSGTVDGATIGGVTPEPGTFTSLAATGLIAESVADALTASVTQTQVGALGLTKQINHITVCAHAADAVRLAALTPGQFQMVFNDGANPAAVWPATGGNIDGAGANTAVTLTNAKRAIFVCVATNVILSAQLGVVSA